MVNTTDVVIPTLVVAAFIAVIIGEKLYYKRKQRRLKAEEEAAAAKREAFTNKHNSSLHKFYVPPHFGAAAAGSSTSSSDNFSQALRLMKDNNFATLLTWQVGTGLMFTSHLPFLFDGEQDPSTLSLLGHLALANPHARALKQFALNPEEWKCLVIFQGPHDYISPKWYPKNGEQEFKQVPTWNYAVVHVDAQQCDVLLPAETKAVVARLSSEHETFLSQTSKSTEAADKVKYDFWKIDQHYADQQVNALLGLRLHQLTVTGKWKMSQNKDTETQQGVIAGLKRHGSAASVATAQVMEEMQK